MYETLSFILGFMSVLHIHNIWVSDSHPRMSVNIKRVSVFVNSNHSDGRVFKLAESWESLLEEIANKLSVEPKLIYSQAGAVIDDIELIRDDDVLYVSSGEPFWKTQLDDHQVKCSQQSGVGSHIEASHCKHEGTDWLKLNVGGKCFITTRNTLISNAPGSMLERMFSEDATHRGLSSSVDKTGAYLIDRSPVYFEPILNYLRHGELVIDKTIDPLGVLEEARFFGVLELVEQLEARVADDQPATDATPITRREFVMHLIHTPTTTELRCQGVNFTRIDLSKLDLRNINFRFTSMKNADLSGANLAECNFERADMYGCVLDGAKLMGVRMLCVNLEGASMKNCCFEDPAGKQAYLEGANLKYVNFEGSSMAGVNLRVATLRKANLQNCDLRGAILAGADMEDADLTGSDLQEANLRGANLNGAYLELIINPLHMSQTIPQGR